MSQMIWRSRFAGDLRTARASKRACTRPALNSVLKRSAPNGDIVKIARGYRCAASLFRTRPQMPRKQSRPTPRLKQLIADVRPLYVVLIEAHRRVVRESNGTVAVQRTPRLRQ